MDRARCAPPIPFPEGARQSQRPGKHSPAAGPDRPGNGFPVCASRPPGTESREPGSPGIGHPEAPTCFRSTPGLRSSGTGSPKKTFTCCPFGTASPPEFSLPQFTALFRARCATIYRPITSSPTAPQFIVPLSPSSSAPAPIDRINSNDTSVPVLQPHIAIGAPSPSHHPGPLRPAIPGSPGAPQPPSPRHTRSPAPTEPH